MAVCIAKKIVLQFLQRMIPDRAPVLIGLSGGRDSMALFHIVTSLKWPCVAVHIDHGWRKESADEAIFVKDMASSYGVKAVSSRLPPIPKGENAEDWSRRERYASFQKIASEFGIHTILLAHHANDQMETVLKRILEGASLCKLRGMREKDVREGLTILRPFLSIERKVIEEYVYKNALVYIDDPSNYDTKYLRPRFRQEIFPYLNERFGKNIEQSLLRLSNEASEIEELLLQETEKLTFMKTPIGQLIFSSSHTTPKKAVVRNCIRSIGTISYDALTSAVHTFCSNSHEVRQYAIGDQTLLVQGGYMLLSKKEILRKISSQDCSGSSGTIQAGNFCVTWREGVYNGEEALSFMDWFPLGRARYFFPSGDFSIQATDHAFLSTIPGKKLIPALLRPYIPSVARGLKLVVEPISGYTTLVTKGTNCTVLEIFSL